MAPWPWLVVETGKDLNPSHRKARGSVGRSFIRVGLHRGHAGRRHRAGDHRRHARRAARGRRAVRARAVLRAGAGRASRRSRAHGTTLPDAACEAAQAADGVILGPVSHHDYPPAAQGGLNPSGELRKRLDLFANIRPARTRAGFPPRCGKPVDLVIVRENTEGFYADRSMFLGSGEFMPTPDLALSMRKITRAGSTRIAEAAFALARAAGARR